MPDCVAYRILTEKIRFADYSDPFLRHLDKNISAQGFTPRTKEMFLRAADLASRSGEKAGTAHFLLAVLEKENCFAVKILRSLGVDVAEMKRRVTKRSARWLRHGRREILPRARPYPLPSKTLPKRIIRISGKSIAQERKKKAKIRIPPARKKEKSGLRAPPEIPRRKKKTAIRFLPTKNLCDSASILRNTRKKANSIP